MMASSTAFRRLTSSRSLAASSNSRFAAASRMPWTSLAVAVEGELDRVQKVTQFTQIRIHAQLAVPADVGVERAERLLQRAEQVCLISNSLKASVSLTTDVRVL